MIPGTRVESATALVPEALVPVKIATE